jgi:DNA polymerase-3 subunit gamma/tau
VAVVQQVPDAAQPAWGDVAAITRLADAIPPDEVQLYYQIALHGQRDLPLAPDERSGFEMLILRLLAFRPASSVPVPVAAQASPAVAGPVSGTRPEPAADPVAAPARTAAAPADSGDAGDAGQPTRADRPAELAKLFDDWDHVLRELSLKGMAAQLARNTVVASWDGRRLELSVDPSCASLLGSVAEDKLASALAAFAAVDLVLELTPGSAAIETPAQRDKREAAARQADTEASIKGDPFVLAAQDIFDAEIVPDSIRRLD